MSYADPPGIHPAGKAGEESPCPCYSHRETQLGLCLLLAERSQLGCKGSSKGAQEDGGLAVELTLSISTK